MNVLKFTGHPLIDVGAATIAAFVKKRDIAQVNEQDMTIFAHYVAKNYVINPLKSFLNVAFPNSGYTQPAFESTPQRRVDYALRVTQSTSSTTTNSDDENKSVCVFTGELATTEWLSAKELNDKEKIDYPRGRAFRHNVPMLTGEGIINFAPYGNAGLPISSKAILCIQAFPLGCAKVGGKLLAVHSDNPNITIKFARKFLDENLKQIQLAQQEGGSKLPEYQASAKTALIATIVEIVEERQEQKEESQPYSVTAYHLSNSGQSNPLDARNPPLEIYQLPLDIVNFLGAVIHVTYRSAWQAISKRGWLLPKVAKANAKTTSQTIEDERPKRNFIYEDLFRLPQNANQFVQRYFLRIPLRHTYAEDPRRAYSLKDEASLVSWQITDLFLRTVMHMDKKRIEQIRNMGDRLAEYVNSENDQKFFATFYAESRSYTVVRNAIIRVSNALVKQGKPPLVSFDSYIEVFEMPDDRGRSDWRFARDLILIRLIERLYELKWIENNPDVVKAAENAAEQQELTPTNN
jgi:CRISPR-associated protein Cst1